MIDGCGGEIKFNILNHFVCLVNQDGIKYFLSIIFLIHKYLQINIEKVPCPKKSHPKY